MSFPKRPRTKYVQWLEKTVSITTFKKLPLANGFRFETKTVSYTTGVKTTLKATVLVMNNLNQALLSLGKSWWIKLLLAILKNTIESFFTPYLLVNLQKESGTRVANDKLNNTTAEEMDSILCEIITSTVIGIVIR